jgi:hypothetical protein
MFGHEKVKKAQRKIATEVTENGEKIQLKSKK